MKRFGLITMALIALVASSTRAVEAQTVPGSGTAADHEAVRRAALDYIEGFYEGDTTKLVRSVAPTVYKYGYSKGAEGYAGSQRRWEGFMSYANGVKSGRNKPPAN